MECEEGFSIGGLELDRCDLDRLAIGGDAEGTGVGVVVASSRSKRKGDGVAIDSGTVDVQRQFRALGAVGDGQIGDRGKIVARGILNHAGCLITLQIAVAEGDGAAEINSACKPQIELSGSGVDFGEDNRNGDTVFFDGPTAVRCSR